MSASCAVALAAFDAWLSGDETGLPVEQIEAHLAGCAACRSQTERFVLADRLLHELAAEKSSVPFRGRLRELLQAEPAVASASKPSEPAQAKTLKLSPGRSRPLLRHWWFAAAAVLLTAGGLWLGRSSTAPAPAPALTLATLLSASPGTEARLETKGAQSATAGMKLFADAGLHVPAGGSARLQLMHNGIAEQSFIELEAGTQLQLGLSAGSKQLTVESGTIHCQVASQPPDRPLLVSTRHAQATVLGTSFTLAVTAEATQLAVQQGQVRIQRNTDRATAVLRAGQAVVVEQRGSGELKVQESAVRPSVEPDEDKEAVHALRWDFERLPAGLTCSGSLVEIPGPTQRVTAITSLRWPHAPRPNWDPSDYIHLRLNNDDALFRVPHSMTLRLRVKAKTLGHIGISLQPIKPEDNEHCYAGNIAVGPEWKEIRVLAKDLKPNRASRPLVEGLEVSGLSVFGFNTGEILVDWLEILTEP